jgi:Regulator of ribonuclease activity B/Family of unknown function (DUF695)
MSLFGRLVGRRRPDWTEAWRTYPGTYTNAPAVWAVDLGVLALAPVSALPVRMDVFVGVTSDDDGLPTDGAQIAELEDAVRAAAARLGGVYVGRVASAGVCRFAAHIPVEPTTPITLSDFPTAPVATAYDPHWAFVRDVLGPDERQLRLLEDLDMVEVLQGQGDPLGTPREVAHVAFFPARSAAEEAAAVLRADGFAAVVEPDDEGEFSLTALRRDPVAPPVVHDLTWAVKETVERHGGTYDGWNCGIAA